MWPGPGSSLRVTFVYSASGIKSALHFREFRLRWFLSLLHIQLEAYTPVKTTNHVARDRVRAAAPGPAGAASPIPGPFKTGKSVADATHVRERGVASRRRRPDDCAATRVLSSVAGGDRKIYAAAVGARRHRPECRAARAIGGGCRKAPCHQPSVCSGASNVLARLLLGADFQGWRNTRANAMHF